jgi:hypothetical protein
MLACTLFTSIAFANNDTLNKIANDNEAYFYPQVNVQNKTRFTATVKITYPGCKNDENIVIAPGGTGLGKSGLARAGCLVTKIEATFAGNGAASVTQITNFSSTGTGASNFIIQESALNEEETQFECMVYRTDKEGMVIGVKPGFKIKNSSNIPIQVQFGTKGYENENTTKIIAPGTTWDINKPSGWYELRIKNAYSFENKGRNFLEHQYSGAPDIFSKASDKPTYEITGNAKIERKMNFEERKEEDMYTVVETFCFKKTNDIGDSYMKLSKRETCEWHPILNMKKFN